MRTRRFSRMILALSMAALFLAGPAGVAAQSSAAGKATAEDPRDQAAETARAIKSYSIEQRDEAVKKAKAALDDIDARISRLESQSREKWDQMDQSTRQKVREAQADLRKKRNDAAEWYGGLKHSSSNAWEEVKKGFVKSYQDLRTAFNQAPGGKQAGPARPAGP
jgi:hypothetical protein